jgi:hypothetical protein
MCIRRSNGAQDLARKWNDSARYKRDPSYFDYFFGTLDAEVPLNRVSPENLYGLASAPDSSEAGVDPHGLMVRVPLT